jgi:ubiquinone/menaquinone biosynthesis C-methylase UbiE
MTETAEKIHHPLFARLYMRTASDKEDKYRRELLAGLKGQVVEVGAGHGLNFACYPEAVERVLAIEPESVLREAAIEAAAKAAVEVEVVEGVAGELPAADQSFDAGIASLVLCSVPDQQRALAELRRVIRPVVSFASTSMSSPTRRDGHECSASPMRPSGLASRAVAISVATPKRR